MSKIHLDFKLKFEIICLSYLYSRKSMYDWTNLEKLWGRIRNIDNTLLNRKVIHCACVEIHFNVYGGKSMF